MWLLLGLYCGAGVRGVGALAFCVIPHASALPEGRVEVAIDEGFVYNRLNGCQPSSAGQRIPAIAARRRTGFGKRSACRNLVGGNQSRNGKATPHSFADGHDVRDEAGFVQADVLRQSGDIEAAQEVAARIVSGEGPLTAGKLRAGLLQAEMKRAAGDTEAAAAAYRDVMRRIAATQEPLDGQSTDLYRQAALNLVQMLRQSGNREEADAVAEEASRQLSRLRERTGS